jgi:hypothetical protein
MPSSVKVQLSKELSQPLPGILDMENNPVSIQNLVMPSFITFDSVLRSFSIKPTNPATDLGVFSVKGIITDTRLMTEFSFKVETYNTPAYFKDKPT